MSYAAGGMFPLKDDIPSRTQPVVNWTIIAVCALVFLIQLGGGSGTGSLSERLGMIPARVLDPERVIELRDTVREMTPWGVRVAEVRRQAEPSLVPAWLTVLTCIFLHGGWLHFLGNMWFLFVFGDNVEDRFGHGGYLAFFLGCGVAASLTQLLAVPDSQYPTIGASGAIAGVMGAYSFLYPRAKVLALIPIFLFFYILAVPAVLFLGIWFALQLLQGAASATDGGGVAWWAHVGGFAVGLAVAIAVGRSKLRPPRAELMAPRPDRPRSYRLHLPRH